MSKDEYDESWWRIHLALKGPWPSPEAWFTDFRHVLTQAAVVPKDDHEWRERIRQHLPIGVVASADDLQQQWVENKIDALVETLKR